MTRMMTSMAVAVGLGSAATAAELFNGRIFRLESA